MYFSTFDQQVATHKSNSPLDFRSKFLINIIFNYSSICAFSVYSNYNDHTSSYLAFKNCVGAKKK